MSSAESTGRQNAGCLCGACMIGSDTNPQIVVVHLNPDHFLTADKHAETKSWIDVEVEFLPCYHQLINE